MEYVIQEGKLDNRVHDISYEQLRLLYEDNLKEAEESERITQSSYRGENYYGKYDNFHYELQQEYLVRDPRTSGMRIYYPHGVIINQAARRNYYRGENRIYEESVPSLHRTLKKYTTVEEQELYRMVADMRIAEFSYLLQKFEHVKNWKVSDILYEALAQHYGLETGWLDITNDFNVALFFATCKWKNGAWVPLTKADTEIDECHQYGMIYHMPSFQMPSRWGMAIPKFLPWTDQVVGRTEDGKEIYGRLTYPIYRGEVGNLIYPLGFQPFMRCHMQNGYGIYMRTPMPLQQDIQFEKLRFRHHEELSQRVYEMMEGGERIYPHEGLKQAEYIIEQIRTATSFSEEAFQYALYRSHYYKVEEAEAVRQRLAQFKVNGKGIEITSKHPWKLSSGRRKRIDQLYQDFDVQESYAIRIMERAKIPEPSAMFEPWMMPEEQDGRGVEDFRVRDRVHCGSSIVEYNTIQMLHTIMTAKLSDF